MELRDYLRVIRERKALIAVTTVLCAGAALVASLVITPVYQADAKLLVLAKTDPTAGASSAYEGALLSQQLAKSFAQILESRPTAEAALRANPEPISAGRLQQRTHAKPIPDTLLINLSVEDTQRARAQRLANSLARAFIAQVPSLQNGSAVSVSLVEPPRQPVAPVKPRIPLNLALGLALGLVTGAALAILRDFLDRSLKSPERVEAATGAPVLGTIPQFKADAAGRPVTTHPRSAAAEAFRKLRTNFSFLGVDRESICCVVSSPGMSDGKSTVTANLGLALAEAGTRVVIVDADLRKPSQHRIFGLQQRIGTTTVLLEQADIRDALQRIDGGPLAILTSGQLPPNPAELLASRHMEELVQSLRASADVVLVDCPPLLPVSDPMVAARFADGVLLTVSAGANTIDQVQAAKVMCEKAGVALVGAILNGTSVGERQQPTEYDYDYFDRAVPANGSKPPTVGTLSDGGPPPIDEEDTDVKRRGRVES